ncbi:unnamed protein product [Caenorhabditis brenneri]
MHYQFESSSPSSSSDDESYTVPQMRPTDLNAICGARFCKPHSLLVCNEQQHITMEPDVKRFKVNSFMDPFGLEEFFKNISSRDIKGTTTSTLPTNA